MGEEREREDKQERWQNKNDGTNDGHQSLQPTFFSREKWQTPTTWGTRSVPDTKKDDSLHFKYKLNYHNKLDEDAGWSRIRDPLPG